MWLNDLHRIDESYNSFSRWMLLTSLGQPLLWADMVHVFHPMFHPLCFKTDKYGETDIFYQTNLLPWYWYPLTFEATHDNETRGAPWQQGCHGAPLVSLPWVASNVRGTSCPPTRKHWPQKSQSRSPTRPINLLEPLTWVPSWMMDKLT